ncbi:MAG: glycosyltransferase [Bdellovibrionaceae bacterium]|nr:glycosyltransferase [Pseudobdellovibrionaceae bacterium]
MGVKKGSAQNELSRLRMLGFEVLESPHLSDGNEGSTLPAEILIQHFDGVLVFADPKVLHAILQIYSGPVIFRTYGQTSLLSLELKKLGLLEQIVERDNFYFMPFCEESLSDEHLWLSERAYPIPFCIANKGVKSKGKAYRLISEIHRKIILSGPLSDDSFPKRYFGDEDYLYCQESQVETSYMDSVGLFYTGRNPRECDILPIQMMVAGAPVIFLKGSLLDALHNFSTPARCENVIEARAKCERLMSTDVSFADEIVKSQEVIAKRFSPEFVWPIFDSFFGELLMGRMPKKKFPSFVIKPQQERTIAHQDKKWIEKTSPKRIYLLHHFPGIPFTYKDGAYIAADGIPRVMRLITKALAEESEFELVITCQANQIDLFYGFFTATLNDQSLKGKIRFLEIDKSVLDSRLVRWLLAPFLGIKGFFFGKSKFSGPTTLEFASPSMSYDLRKLSETAKLRTSAIFIGTKHRLAHFRYKIYYRIFSKLGPSWWFGFGLILSPVVIPIVILMRLTKQIFDVLKNSSLYLSLFEFFKRKILFVVQKYSSLTYLSAINGDSKCEWVIVPHYFLFPEAQFIEKNLAIYIPDFTPFFYSETSSFGDHGYETLVAKSLTERAKVVITNSEYTKNYLPLTPLGVQSEKIEVFFLPNLSQSESRVDISRNTSNEVLNLKDKIKGRKFLIYPTQIRPNKNINLLLEVFEEVRVSYPNLLLILTGTFENNAQCQKTFSDLQLSPHVVFALGVSDGTLSWLYSTAECLVLTSQIEGNFPPQVLEALALKCPVVASKIPLIEEVARDVGDYLLLADPASPEEFISQILYVFGNRGIVLERQERLQEILRTRNSWNQFTSGLFKALHINTRNQLEV